MHTVGFNKHGGKMKHHVIRLQKEILITRYFMMYELAGKNKTEINYNKDHLYLRKESSPCLWACPVQQSHYPSIAAHSRTDGIIIKFSPTVQQICNMSIVQVESYVSFAPERKSVKLEQQKFSKSWEKFT